VKTDVEELSPTRVRLTVEVPFDELKASLDHAYREIGRQVQIRGFRPGHVPRQVLDQRVGRGAVLEHAINEAVPDLYAQAVREAQVAVLGQPEVEITKLDDGTEIAFTAEVDIRPNFDLPDLDSLQVVVDDADVSPDQVEEYLLALRERFASLLSVDRPVQNGDYVSIDLSAQVDGEDVADAQATGISYEVGSGSILDGLDEALIGMSAEETATFQSELAGGEHEGRQADVTVTVRSVKVKDLPDLDDDFAQSASEYNTVGELRSNTRRQMEAMRRAGQAGQARDRAIEALLDQVDIPLPQAIVDHEISHRHESLSEDLDRAGLAMADFLEGRNLTPADLDKEISDEVRRSIKARFILDKIAEADDLSADQDELAAYVTQIAYQQGVAPEALIRQLANSGQIGVVMSDLVRGKAADLIASKVKVTDQSGRAVDFTSQEPGAEGADDDDSQGQADDEADSAPKAKASRRGAAAKPRARARRGAKEQDADEETPAEVEAEEEAEQD
jgi:trigger factor